MASRRRKLALHYGGIGLAIGALVVAAGVGGYTLGTASNDSTSDVPPQMLSAMGATHGETLALATGPMDEMEAVFVLDYLTGDLQCWVIGSRTGKFISQFKYNVTADLGIEQGKKPDYVMVTGAANFSGGGVANNIGETVVYVGDGNSGNVAAYAVPWNPNLGSRNAPQQGSLILLGMGKARLAAIRQ